MAALPYMQLYVTDYLADTPHLSTEEHGAYLLLIFNYWQTGKPLPKTRLAGIARLSNERWTEVERSLNEFFLDTGSEWIHERIERDLVAVKGAQTQRSDAGKKSAAKRAQEKRLKEQMDNNGRSTTVQRHFNDRSTNKDTDKDTDINTDQEILPAAAKAQQPADAVGNDEVFISLPLNDGTEFPVVMNYLAELAVLYPAIDVAQEFRLQRGWLLGNPRNRKTKTGIKRFISTWLAKAQNAAPRVNITGGSHGNAAAGPAGSNAVQQVREARNADRIRQGLAPLGNDGTDLCQSVGEQERRDALGGLDRRDFEILG
ncbi:YdaU family protein [Rahnella aceris]|uniref:YdaU family protein n=1 Tax=Rahnella sp. (strain Y9602) TaxID=2703885 RepID=UPI0020B6FE06|nr:DUF1376 domain-containing protein [Rahnella aceris]